MVAYFVRSRYIFFPIALTLAVLIILFLRLDLRGSLRSGEIDKPEPEPRRHPIYKDRETKTPAEIPEYFPLAAKANSPADLPPIPSWNRPPAEHVPEKTRLYIGFTRFWPLLQQVIVSYITAGWPPEDIYIVENTGTMDANKHGRLSIQNPFYLDYHRLTKIFGVNIITTPSLQSFAQLQNMYLSEAINNNLSYYFWGHMDVVVQSHEHKEPYKSLYMRAIDTIRETQQPDYPNNPWAIQFFAYDWLALVNVESFAAVGGWDTMVSYYGTDCDMYARLGMAKFHSPIAEAGEVYDVGRSLDNLEILYRRKLRNPNPSTPNSKRAESNITAPSSSAYTGDTVEDSRNSEGYTQLVEELKNMTESKKQDPYRNSWQLRQSGGEGEPYYYDPEGFEKALQMQIEVGVKINEEKWGHRGCDIGDTGLGKGDEWKVEHDE